MSDLIVLKVYRGNRLISVKQFLQSQIVIGRQSDSGLVLDDESISPVHAVIERRDGEYYLSDLGSEMGIYLEGVKTLESKIMSGECLEIGPYTVRFYEGIPRPAIEPDYSGVHDKPEPKMMDVEKEESDQESSVEIKMTKSSPPPLPLDENDEVDELTDPGIEIEDEVTNPGIDLSEEDVPSIEGVDIVQKENVPSEPLTLEDSSSVSSGPKNIEEIINPTSRGSVVEAILAWQERVLATYHFTENHDVIIANYPGEHMFIPLPGPKFKHHLLVLGDLCIVNIASSMAGELYQNGRVVPLKELPRSNKLQVQGGNSRLKLEQGEMVRLGLLGDKVSVYVRYVEDAPKAVTAPFFDFTSAELVGIFMSAVVVSVIALYMLFYAPGSLDNPDKLLEEHLRKATITFNPPPRLKRDPDPPPPEPEKKKPEIKKVTEVKSKPEKKKPEKKPDQAKPGRNNKKPEDKKVVKKPPSGAKPSRNKVKNQAGSSRTGGAVKTGKEAANAKSKEVDITQTGLMSALAGGGKNSALDKAYSGVGTTIGTADKKTGFQGQKSASGNEGIGTKLQTPGAGGKGKNLVGIGSLKGVGRSADKIQYGASGLKGKGKANIKVVDGAGKDFFSSIDQDAIRRLIRKNRNLLAGCYEKALAKNKNLSGKIVLQWNIIQGGKMTSGKVKSSSIPDKSVSSCVIRRLMSLKFPDPGPNEIAQVVYPFVFESR